MGYDAAMFALAAFVVLVIAAVYSWVATTPTHLWTWLFVGLALMALDMAWSLAVPRFSRRPPA